MQFSQIDFHFFVHFVHFPKLALHRGKASPRYYFTKVKCYSDEVILSPTTVYMATNPEHAHMRQGLEHAQSICTRD